jgi:hypothetical protein
MRDGLPQGIPTAERGSGSPSRHNQLTTNNYNLQHKLDAIKEEDRKSGGTSSLHI